MEDGQLSVNFDCLPIDGGQAFLGQYKGGFTDIAQSPYHFTVDGKRMEMRAAFAEKVADGTAFYLTPGNIDRANDLENCYYYVRLFVPESNMDGSEIDINGQKQYELTFVDNATDVNNPQTISISNGKTGNATGSVSVLKNADGTYDITIRESVNHIVISETIRNRHDDVGSKNVRSCHGVTLRREIDGV